MRCASTCSSLILCLAAIAPACGEVKQSTADNFVIVHSVQVKAAPAKAYAAIAEPNRWWNGQHSYSGNAANFTLKAEAGACFCERWNGSSVEHGVVIMALQDRLLRLRAPLGPLQGRGLNAVLTFEVKPRDDGAAIELTYVVNGSSASALDKSAPAVDGVLGEALARLGRYIDTGKPDSGS
ncbi:MAG TPA: ATPase [Casimicrobiaceae bacterium]|nr:ATPase [Casimicrobiaceae bacterium]